MKLLLIVLLTSGVFANQKALEGLKEMRTIPAVTCITLTNGKVISPTGSPEEEITMDVNPSFVRTSKGICQINTMKVNGELKSFTRGILCEMRTTAGGATMMCYKSFLHE